MKIIVLVKQVPDTYGERKLDTVTGLLNRSVGDRVIDEINERALETALSYKDSHSNAEVVVLSMGPATATEALRKALSMGADAAVHVVDDALVGSDLGLTSRVLAAAVARTGYDLLVAGNESTDGRGGVIPSMIAERLAIPHLSSMATIEISESSVSGERRTEAAAATVHAALPAIVSVTESAPEARFPNFKGIMTAKRKPLTTLSVSELDVDLTSGGRSVVTITTERPVRSAGTKIIDDGNAAVKLAEFLAAGRLI